jgi:transposase
MKELERSIGHGELERLIELSSAEPHEKTEMLRALAEMSQREELTEPQARRELAKNPSVDVCPGCGLHVIGDIVARIRAVREKRTLVCPRCGIRKRAGKRESPDTSDLPSF